MVGQLAEGRFLPGRESLVKLGQFPAKNPSGPIVKDEMMGGQMQIMIVGLPPHQPGPKQRAAAQIEGTTVLRHPGPFHSFHNRPLRRDNELNQFAVHHPENRPQHFVAPHDFLHAAFKGVYVQRPAKAQQQRIIIDRAVRVRRIFEPRLLLGKPSRYDKRVLHRNVRVFTLNSAQDQGFFEKLTRNDVKPRRPELVRHSNGPGSSDQLGK